MRIVQTAAPLREPVLLDEVKEHIRVDGDHDDATISSFIAASRAAVEATAGLYLVERNVDVYVDSWAELAPELVPGRPNSCWLQPGQDYVVPGSRVCSIVRLPVRPVAAVTSINLIDDEDAEIEWPTENYQLVPGLEPFLCLASNAAWPSPNRKFEGVKISATAGFGPNWNSVPEVIQQAVIMMATKLYVCRGDEAHSSANLLKSCGASGLLQSFRRMQL